MSLQDQARNRNEALGAVTFLVRKAKRERTMVDVHAEAGRIHRAFPDCELSRDELEREMIRLSISDHVAIAFGQHRFTFSTRPEVQLHKGDL